MMIDSDHTQGVIHLMPQTTNLSITPYHIQ